MEHTSIRGPDAILGNSLCFIMLHSLCSALDRSLAISVFIYVTIYFMLRTECTSPTSSEFSLAALQSVMQAERAYHSLVARFSFFESAQIKWMRDWDISSCVEVKGIEIGAMQYLYNYVASKQYIYIARKSWRSFFTIYTLCTYFVAVCLKKLDSFVFTEWLLNRLCLCLTTKFKLPPL